MHFAKPANGRRNVNILVRFLVLLAIIVGVFTTGFHLLMVYEDQDHSWLTGFYWTMVTMSTLGFGDVTFQTDLGKAFSVVVLMTGILFLLVLMPFTFIEFFYSPWMKAQQEARAPRSVPSTMRDHVILANYDAVTVAFINRLQKYNIEHVLAVGRLDEALAFHDQGVSVVLADLEDPASFGRLGMDRAAMLVATSTDVANTAIAFSARETSKDLVIAATANSKDSVDVLNLAGCDHVIELGDMLGASLARRTIAGDAQAHIIGVLEEIHIAEATADGTPLVGKTLRDSRLRETAGVTVVGIWEKGKFRLPAPTDIITSGTVFLLAGTAEQIAHYNALFCIYHRSLSHAIIVGAGRVGRAAARMLGALESDYRIVDKNPSRASLCHPGKFICGSAADHATLVKAGIREAPAILITTHEDDVNIYLTIYARKLRPDIQIIARATHESNTQRLHRAGADLVMSYATMGAGILFNLLRKGGDILMVAEGLHVFRLPLPDALEGVKLAESRIREKSGCSVIALQRDDRMQLTPDPSIVLQRGDGLVLIGTVDAEDTFLRKFRAEA